MPPREQSEPFELESMSFGGTGRFMTTAVEFTAYPKENPKPAS
jgi:hypothetical protein